MTKDKEGWITHDGNGCPVASDTVVEVKYRRLIVKNIDLACAFSWYYDPLNRAVNDIVSYRVFVPLYKLEAAQARIAELEAQLIKAHQEGYKEGVEAALSIAAAQIKIKAYNSSKNPMREDMVKWSDVVAMRDNICANIQALKKEGA